MTQVMALSCGLITLSCHLSLNEAGEVFPTQKQRSKEQSSWLTYPQAHS